MMEPIWLRSDAVIAIHERLLADHGGPKGLRDAGLLDSALTRPRQVLAYEEPDLCALAAAYGFGIIRNLPFVDGNKRVALMSAYVFLALNGLTLTAIEAGPTQAVLQLAAGDMPEEQFAPWLRDNTAADNEAQATNH